MSPQHQAFARDSSLPLLVGLSVLSIPTVGIYWSYIGQCRIQCTFCIYAKANIVVMLCVC